VEGGSIDKVYSNPIHPYTRMLMASVPRLDRKWEKVRERLSTAQEENELGCVYYSRCPNPLKCCADESPELLYVESDHFVACNLVGRR